MLRLAASLAGDIPVQLGNAVTGIDDRKAGEPGAVGDDQPDGGLERVDAFGGDAEHGWER